MFGVSFWKKDAAVVGILRSTIQIELLPLSVAIIFSTHKYIKSSERCKKQIIRSLVGFGIIARNMRGELSEKNVQVWMQLGALDIAGVGVVTT